eukprot:scaffold2388_cov163-Amphora_coffeaeformis.AAC.7
MAAAMASSEEKEFKEKIAPLMAEAEVLLGKSGDSISQEGLEALARWKSENNILRKPNTIIIGARLLTHGETRLFVANGTVAVATPFVHNTVCVIYEEHEAPPSHLIKSFPGRCSFDRHLVQEQRPRWATTIDAPSRRPFIPIAMGTTSAAVFLQPTWQVESAFSWIDNQQKSSRGQKGPCLFTASPAAAGAHDPPILVVPVVGCCQVYHVPYRAVVADHLLRFQHYDNVCYTVGKKLQ